MGKIKSRQHRKWSYNSLHIQVPFVRGTFRESCRENRVAKHIMLACCRIRRKRDGHGVRHASQGEEGVHLMLANPPWHQLRERAEKIPGDKKHVEGFSREALELRRSIQHRTAQPNGELRREYRV